MIDEKTDEILSRYLDGDLGSDEERKFGERLERDPALVEALNEMRSLRQTLRQLALAERPPEVLDQMVRPLRRAGRPMRQRWVAAALVAAAAVVVVAVIVVSEIGRTGWMPWNRPPGEEDGKIFALSNLPSRDPEAPLGAIESLLAEDNSEPVLVDPEPLEVMGPLDRPPGLGDSGLALKIGTILVSIPPIVGTEGLKVTLGVEEGRVTSCSTPKGVEPTLEAGDVCRQILLVGGIGLDDGQYEAVVVRWAEETDSGE